MRSELVGIILLAFGLSLISVTADTVEIAFTLLRSKPMQIKINLKVGTEAEFSIDRITVNVYYILHSWHSMDDVLSSKK